jgi:replicative DNA helicase
MAETRDYSTILMTPEDIGNQTAAYLKQRKENAAMGVRIGLKSIDEADDKGDLLLPMLPGELMGILARPGNGKTSFMVRWARHRAAFLREKNIKDRAVVYVTLEQSIEELNAFNLAADTQISPTDKKKRLSITKMALGNITQEEWEILLREGIKRRFLPLWNIGYSSMTDKKQIRVDVDAIRGALEIIQTKHQFKIDLVFVDYLQRIPYDRAESKTVGVSDNLDALKTLALTLRAPFVVGVQARREVDESDDKLPSLDDGQWTSNVEQSCDKILSLMRPAMYFKEGEKVGSTVVRGFTQMCIKILKQKLGPANFARWVEFNPIYNTLEELAMNPSAQTPARR